MIDRITDPDSPHLCALHAEWSALREANRRLAAAEHRYAQALGVSPHLVHKPHDPTHQDYDRALRAQTVAHTAFREAVDSVHRATGRFVNLGRVSAAWEERARSTEGLRLLSTH